MNKVWLLLVSASMVVSCQKNASGTDGNTNLPAVAQSNVAYGADYRQVMDIYLPAGRSSSSTPFMVMIHGGGWTTGDKADIKPYIDSVKKYLPQYAVFNINYRLSSNGTNTFPAQEQDVKAAVDFIASKASAYNISDKMVLLGASAGGHLALLQGYKYTDPVKAAAIVDFFGPADITAMYTHPASPAVPAWAVAAVVGATPEANAQLYQQSSPISFVNSSSAPTIIFQGGQDPLVAPAQSEALKNKLQQAGVANEYVFYPNEQHGWSGANLAHSFDRLVQFLNQHVR